MSHVSTYEKAVGSLDTSIRSLESLRDAQAEVQGHTSGILNAQIDALRAISEALKANAPTIQVRAPFGPTRLK